jgi:hypothetical protein
MLQIGLLLQPLGALSADEWSEAIELMIAI